MTTRSERERQQKQNERYKSVLAKLLAKEENKFCADCLSKGPRWVSWNLGVLLCIRCSGIHRSLGVHISKVKSVNLDTWTTDQITRLCGRGNGWAKDYYEANLPKGFKRPGADSSLEYFIRDKYEKRKYCASREVSLRPIQEFNINEVNEESSPKVRPRNKNVSNGTNPNIITHRLDAAPPIARPKTNIIPSMTATSKPQRQAVNGSASESSVNDLLGLGTPVQNPAPATVPTPAAATQSKPPPSADLTFDLFASIQANDSSNAIPSSQTTPPTDSSASQPAPTTESKIMSKDSILSLYGNQPAMSQFAQSNPYNANAGAYGMPNQQQAAYGQPQQPQATARNPQMDFQMGMNNPYNMQQQAGAMGMQMNGMVGYQQMPAVQQQQQYQWQQMQQQQQQQQQQQPQQHLHQQMHNLQLGGAGGFGAQHNNQQQLAAGGMRSYNSMPQMFGAQQQQQQQQQQPQQQQQQACGYGNQLMPGALTHNGLASSQPSLVGVDQGMAGWGGGPSFNAGQTLSTQLWK